MGWMWSKEWNGCGQKWDDMVKMIKMGWMQLKRDGCGQKGCLGQKKGMDAVKKWDGCGQQWDGRGKKNGDGCGQKNGMGAVKNGMDVVKKIKNGTDVVVRFLS